MVLLDLVGSTYFALDAVGTSMFETLLESPSVAAAVESVVALYEVEPLQARPDLLRLLTELTERGLIGLEAGPASSSA